jgi:hypothetical protein
VCSYVRRDRARLKCRAGWKLFQHASDRVVDPLLHPIAVAEHVLDAVLRPAAPDEAIRSSVDDVEYERSGLLFDCPDTAGIAVAVAAFAVEPVDVDASADVGVIVDKRVWCVGGDSRESSAREPFSIAPCT